MRRAKGVSQQIWDATRGMLLLLGASAPFTYGIANATTPNYAPLYTLVLAVLAVFLGAFTYFLAQYMTASREKRVVNPERTANILRSRPGAYAALGVFMFVQILALPTAAVLQGWAVYQTLQGRNSTTTLDSELADRIQLYAGSDNALYLVKGYCEKHVSDDPASDAFLSGCIRFNKKPPPTPKEARDIASKLR
jgi:hypothetical protein